MMKTNKREGGWVIVTAMAVMALILLFGLATLKLVDNQASQSGRERVRESGFNLAEGLLYAQAATLKSNWPTKAPCGTVAKGCGYIPTCNSTITGTTASLQCPDVSGSLAGTQKIFNNQDVENNFLTGATGWTVQVRDDVGGVVGGVQQSPDPIYFGPPSTDPTCTTANKCVNATYSTTDQPCGGQVCTWDANKNRKLWVRVDAKVKNRATGQTQTRSIVALLQLENFTIPFKNNAVVGGYVDVSNNGNKTVVESTGSQVVTRCRPIPYDTVKTASAVGANQIQVTTGGTQWSGLSGKSIAIDTGTGYEVRTWSSFNSATGVVTFTSALGKAHAVGAQIMLEPSGSSSCQGWDPSKTQLNPPGAFIADPSYPTGLGAGSLTALQAGADSVWTNDCPSTQAEWTGKIVITQTPAAGCTVNPPGGADLNSLTSPGYIVVLNGTLTVKANAVYYGVIYMANQQNSTGIVLDLSGNPTVVGGVAVDGQGGVILGSGSGTHASVEYNKNAFDVFGAIGAAGLVQNTWRELGPGQ